MTAKTANTKASAASTAPKATKKKTTVSVQEHDYLDQDPQIRGQNYACVSFVSPEEVLARKDVFFFKKFINSVANDIDQLLLSIELRFGSTDDATNDSTINTIKTIKTTDSANSTTEEVAAVASDVPAPAVESTDATATEATDAEVVAEVVAEAESTESNDEDDQVLKKFNEDIKKRENAQYIRETIRMLRERYSYLWSAEDASSNGKENRKRGDDMQTEYNSFVQLHGALLEDAFRKENNFTTSIRGLKIRGVYDSLDEATTRAKAIKRFDKQFHVYVAQVGCWCPWNPNPDDIRDAQYDEEQLNTLMKKYVEGHDHKDEMYESRKSQMIKDINEERDEWIKRQQERLKDMKDYGKPVNSDVQPAPPPPAAVEAVNDDAPDAPDAPDATSVENVKVTDDNAVDTV